MLVKHNYLKENREQLEREYWKDSYDKRANQSNDSMTFTLNPEEVGWVEDKRYESLRLTKKHKDGWTIHAEVKENYYYYIDEFWAQHKKYGTIKGSFDSIVTAESEEAYQHFIKHHKPRYWNMADI